MPILQLLTLWNLQRYKAAFWIMVKFGHGWGNTCQFSKEFFMKNEKQYFHWEKTLSTSYLIFFIWFIESIIKFYIIYQILLSKNKQFYQIWNYCQTQPKSKLKQSWVGFIPCWSNHIPTRKSFFWAEANLISIVEHCRQQQHKLVTQKLVGTLHKPVWVWQSSAPACIFLLTRIH